MKINIVYVFALLITIYSCDKNKKYAERIAGNWNISELTIDENQMVQNLPNLKIRQSDIYEHVNTGEWISGYGDTCKFYWQFSDKGKHFTFTRIDDESCTSQNIPESDEQVFDYSGKYEVIKHDKDKFVFETNNSAKFPGKKVRLIIER